MKDFFRWEDFIEHVNPGIMNSDYVLQMERMARLANKKLNAEIERWPIVGTGKNQDSWNIFEKSDDLFVGRIAFIEPIKKKECDHSSVLLHGSTSTGICHKCDKRVRAKWEVVE